MKITTNEQNHLRTISEKMDSLKSYLISKNEDYKFSICQWYIYISQFKRIMGNLNNDVSFIACILAKQFLTAFHRISSDFDVADKPQGASGLDIDIKTVDGKRIIAEIKTTIPYKPNDLGAQQKKMFKKDFQKLNKESADHKYFFVTEEKTFQIVKNKYLEELKGISVVLVPAALNNSKYIIRVPSDSGY
ncbi:hypothetical protein [Maledivibacter halophilus]|uniref:Uncharacterized protein n=1 Tax=Maledivibacter halophilus TaxID=36842 RepID=A0A1T5MQM7_9FIRM|nr:hypothetical protein [Maledivibacter halophilus]SKC90511.1 hypothetical protein SAMN02194393_05178 [Maledivibacter halophilus]